MVAPTGSLPAEDGLDDLWITVRRRLADRLRDNGLSKRDRWVMSQLSVFFNGHTPNPPGKTAWIPYLMPTYAVAPTRRRQRGEKPASNGSGAKAEECGTQVISPSERRREAHCPRCGALIVSSSAVGTRNGK